MSNEGRGERSDRAVVTEGEYMDDQRGHEAKTGERRPVTSMFDMEEFASRLMHARADKRWRTTIQLGAALDGLVADQRLPRSIPMRTLYRMERGIAVPDADDLLLLDAVFGAEGGPLYFMPKK